METLGFMLLMPPPTCPCDCDCCCCWVSWGIWGREGEDMWIEGDCCWAIGEGDGIVGLEFEGEGFGGF